jgi:hypothetical protein
MMFPLRRCQPFPIKDRETFTLRVLAELDEEIGQVKREIRNLRIAGFHHKANKKEKFLRFLEERRAELVRSE